MDRKRLYDLCEASVLTDGGDKQWEAVLNQEIEHRKKAVIKLENYVLENPEHVELLERMRQEHLAPVFQLLHAPKDQLTIKMMAALFRLIDDVHIKKSTLSDWIDKDAKAMMGTRTSKSDFGGIQLAMCMAIYDMNQVFPIEDAVGLLIRTYRKIDPIHFLGLYTGAYTQPVDEHVSQMVKCANTGTLTSKIRHETIQRCGV